MKCNCTSLIGSVMSQNVHSSWPNQEESFGIIEVRTSLSQILHRQSWSLAYLVIKWKLENPRETYSTVFHQTPLFKNKVFLPYWTAMFESSAKLSQFVQTCTANELYKRIADRTAQGCCSQFATTSHQTRCCFLYGQQPLQPNPNFFTTFCCCENDARNLPMDEYAR